jgi:hypothetical protein
MKPDLARLVGNLDVPCEYAEGPLRCHQRASLIVHVHQIDRCSRSPETADVHGDYVFMACSDCADRMAWRIGVIVGEMYAELPDVEEELIVNCKTCGRLVRDMDDVMKVEDL